MKFKSKKHMAKMLLKNNTYINSHGSKIFYDEGKSCSPFRIDKFSLGASWDTFNQDIWTKVEPEEPFDIYSILEKDSPCMVSGDLKCLHLRFYSGKSGFYLNGLTSHASTGRTKAWREVRLPTPAELPINIKCPWHPSLGKPEGICGMTIVVWIDGVPDNTCFGCESFWKETSTITAYMILDK